MLLQMCAERLARQCSSSQKAASTASWPSDKECCTTANRQLLEAQLARLAALQSWNPAESALHPTPANPT